MVQIKFRLSYVKSLSRYSRRPYQSQIC